MLRLSTIAILALLILAPPAMADDQPACPATASTGTKLTAPAVDDLAAGMPVTGTVKDAPKGAVVMICVNGKASAAATGTDAINNSTFKVTLKTPLAAGDSVQAYVTQGTGGATDVGPASAATKVPDCPSAPASSSPPAAPSLSAVGAGFWVPGSVQLPKDKDGKAVTGATIVVCADGQEAQAVAATAAPASDGSFYIQLQKTLTDKQKVRVQLKLADGSYGYSSDEATVNAQPTPGTVACTEPSGTTSLLKPVLKSIDPGIWVEGNVPQTSTPTSGSQSSAPASAAQGTTAKSKVQIIICIDGQQAQTAGSTTPASDQSFHIEVTSPKLQNGQRVTAQESIPGTAGVSAAFGPLSDAVTVGASAASFDFGRVRIYLSAGAILSQDQGQFSKTSAYLDFDADSTWLMHTFPQKSGSTHPPRGLQINTLFDARLTALPATTCTAASGTSTSGAGTTSTSCDTTTTVTPSLSTPKAALIAGGLYVPNYFGWSSWRFDEDGHRYALYFAPLAKGGFQTLVQSAQSSTGTASGTTTSVTTIGGNTFFHFFEFGGRLGLYKFHDEHKGVAPDQLMYLDIAAGRYQNFPSINTTTGAATGYPWRLGMEGRFMVPKVPVFLGFNSNTKPGSHLVTNAPGDLRFLFGTSFDVGCLLQKVGVSNPGIAACDEKKSSSSSTTTGSAGTGK